MISFDDYVRDVVKPAAERARRDPKLWDGCEDRDVVGEALVAQGILKATGVGRSGYVEWELPDFVIGAAKPEYMA